MTNLPRIPGRRGWLAASVIAIAAVFALSVVPTPAHANDKAKPYALIYGTVFDPDGRTLYGVRVKIRKDGEKKVRWELYSNHTGEFAQRVPVGPTDYVISADTKGYKLADGRKLQPGEDVKVHIERDERQDISLHPHW